MKKIDQIIPRVINKKGLNPQIEASYICYQSNKIAGRKFQAISFQNGLLTLKVGDSFMAQEIQLQQLDLIKKINQQIGFNKVKKIKFQVKNK